jgi:hypothetical protein
MQLCPGMSPWTEERQSGGKGRDYLEITDLIYLLIVFFRDIGFDRLIDEVFQVIESDRMIDWEPMNHYIRPVNSIEPINRSIRSNNSK